MIRAEALALVEAAERDAKRGTPGPWTVGRVPGAHQNDAAPYMVHDESEKQVADCYDNTSWSPRDCGDNAQLIVAMRSREPQLAAALREALAEVERLSSRYDDEHGRWVAEIKALRVQLRGSESQRIEAEDRADAWRTQAQATIAELKLRIPDVATERELALLRCVVDAIDDASSYDELSSIKVTTPDGGRHYLAYATEQARAARSKP